jgi:hypothetical protein
MEGTTDIEYIINWINLIVSLKIAAKKMSYKEIENLLGTMNTTSGYYWLADNVFKEYQGFIINQPTFKQDVEMCISKTKSIFLAPAKGTEVLLINT